MTRIKNIVLRWAIRHILHAVHPDELLRQVGGKLFIGSHELRPEEKSRLKADANSFHDSYLWKIIENNLYWIANFKMIQGSNWERDMDHGRMMTLCIGTIKDFVEKLKKI